MEAPAISLSYSQTSRRVLNGNTADAADLPSESAEGLASLGRRQAHRAALKEGTRLFCIDAVDGRTKPAKRFWQLYDEICGDLGGDALLSEMEKQGVKSLASVLIMREAIDVDLLRGLPVSFDSYGILMDRQRRMSESLGWKRRARPALTLDAVATEIKRSKGDGS